MKFYKSTIENTSLSELEKGKVKLHVNNEDVEGIWVAKDPENKKMYLLNHALAFYPVPSWGSEWDLASEINVAEVRGETPNDVVLTFHNDAYEHLKEFIDSEDNYDLETADRVSRERIASGEEGS